MVRRLANLYLEDITRPLLVCYLGSMIPCPEAWGKAMRRRSRAGGEPARTRANFAGEMIKKRWDHSLGDNVNQRALSILVAAAGTLHSPSQKLVSFFATLCVCFLQRPPLQRIAAPACLGLRLL